MTSGDDVGVEVEVEVGTMQAEGGGGPPRPGPAMDAAFTGTYPRSTPVTTQRRPHKTRQQAKEDDGVGPAPGPAIGANPGVDNNSLQDAASGPGPGPCNAVEDEDPDPNPLLKDDEEVGDAAPGPGPGPNPAPAMDHQSTACNTAEDIDANPMFKDAPCRFWKLYSNPDPMVKENQDVMNWVDQLLAEEADMYCIMEEGQSHYLHQTTDEPKFFKLVLQPDIEALAKGQAMEGVTLVFSLKDLYLLGFLYKNTWYFYLDATLDGSGHNQLENERYWDYLPFNGGYAKDMFTNVMVGAYELNLSHHTLSEYLSRLKKGQQDEIQNALYRIIIVIAEAKRFPQWLQVLQQSFAGKHSIVAGTFGPLFQDWSTICKRVLKGPEDFKPDSYFTTYGELVRTISVLLKSAFDDDDTSVDSIDWQSKEVLFETDSDYDLKEEECEEEESEEDDDDEHSEREKGQEEEDAVTEEEDEHKERKEMGEDDSDRTEDLMEENGKDAIIEKDKKSGGQRHTCCYWIIFFMCVMLLLVWMIVF